MAQQQSLHAMSAPSGLAPAQLWVELGIPLAAAWALLYSRMAEGLEFDPPFARAAIVGVGLAIILPGLFGRPVLWTPWWRLAMRVIGIVAGSLGAVGLYLLLSLEIHAVNASRGLDQGTLSALQQWGVGVGSGVPWIAAVWFASTKGRPRD